MRGTQLLAPAPAVPHEGLPAEHRERGKRVWSATLEVPPQRGGALRLDYVVPRAVRAEDGRRVYRLVVQHQPKVHPETLDVRLRLPGGARAVRAPGWEGRGRELRWRGPLLNDMVLEVSWRTPEG